jgi:WD40 repeat protein
MFVGEYLLVGATDGKIRVYDHELQLLKTMQLHQSGVKALDARITNGKLTIATGGDDGKVVLVTLKELDATEHLEQHAHISSIVGVHLQGSRLLSVSVDHRVRDFSLELVLQNKWTLDVPDSGSSALEGDTLVVVGHGMQVCLLAKAVVACDVDSPGRQPAACPS